MVPFHGVEVFGRAEEGLSLSGCVLESVQYSTVQYGTVQYSTVTCPLGYNLPYMYDGYQVLNPQLNSPEFGCRCDVDVM